MKIERANEILNNKEIKDIYYNNRVVWIQELNNDIAKVGFMDNNEEMNISVDQLQEN